MAKLGDEMTHQQLSFALRVYDNSIATKQKKGEQIAERQKCKLITTYEDQKQ